MTHRLNALGWGCLWLAILCGCQPDPQPRASISFDQWQGTNLRRHSFDDTNEIWKALVDSLPLEPNRRTDLRDYDGIVQFATDSGRSAWHLGFNLEGPNHLTFSEVFQSVPDADLSAYQISASSQARLSQHILSRLSKSPSEQLPTQGLTRDQSIAKMKANQFP